MPYYTAISNLKRSTDSELGSNRADKLGFHNKNGESAQAKCSLLEHGVTDAKGPR